MAKKSKEFDFDLDDVLDTIESFNKEYEDDAYEIEEGDPDLMFQYFVEIMMKASEDEEILEALSNKDAAIKLYNSIPDDHPVLAAVEEAMASDSKAEKKEDDEVLPEDGPELGDDSDDDEGDGGVVDDDEEEAAPEPKKEKKGKGKEEKPKKEKKPVETEDDGESDDDFQPECPEFGHFNDESDECSTCSDDYPEEYKRCRKLTSQVKEKSKAENKKPVEEEPKKKSKKSDDDDEPKAKKPKKAEKEEKPAGKRGRPAKVEEEPAEEPKAKFQKSEKPKSKESKESKEEKSEKKARKSLSSITGRQVADFFRRVGMGGTITECLVVSSKESMVVETCNVAQNVLSHVESNFPIGYVGKFGVGDISKVIKFASSVGDGEIEFDITNERLVLRSSTNKVKLLLSSEETLQTIPGDDLSIDEIIDQMDCSSVISVETAKDLIFDIKLIKNDVLQLQLEDNKLHLVGGESTSDKFSIQLKKPELSDDAIDRDTQISAGNFANCLGVTSLSTEPIELLFCSDEAPVTIRQGNDVWCFVNENGTAV